MVRFFIGRPAMAVVTLCVAALAAPAAFARPAAAKVLAPATCARALTADFSRDSASFTLTDNSVGPSNLAARVEDARMAVRKVAVQAGCGADFGVASAGTKANDTCAELVRGNPFSVSCYVESTDGYFFVTRDMLENTNVVFNRWD